MVAQRHKRGTRGIPYLSTASFSNQTVPERAKAGAEPLLPLFLPPSIHHTQILYSSLTSTQELLIRASVALVGFASGSLMPSVPPQGHKTNGSNSTQTQARGGPAVGPRDAVQTSLHCWVLDPICGKSFQHIQCPCSTRYTTAGKGKQQPAHSIREEQPRRDTSLEEIHQTVSAAALYRRGTRASGGCLLLAAQVGRHSRISTE